MDVLVFPERDRPWKFRIFKNDFSTFSDSAKYEHIPDGTSDRISEANVTTVG
jgi:hypothetical protein